MANTGIITVTERDINPFSPTYNTTRTRTYEDLTRCPLPANYKLSWTTTGGNTGLVACDSSTTLTYSEGPINNRSTVNYAHVGDCVTTIDGTFNGYTALASVDISSSVTSIGDFSFLNCSNLTGITIPDAVTTIGGQAFRGCSKLAAITIPDSVTSIGANVFKSCTELANVTLSSRLSEIPNSAFSECFSLRDVVIPSSVSTISTKAFEYCGGLTSITCLSTTPPTLRSGAFANTNSTFTIYVPSASVNSYKTASGWSAYASRIQAIPT